MNFSSSTITNLKLIVMHIRSEGSAEIEFISDVNGSKSVTHTVLGMAPAGKDLEFLPDANEKRIIIAMEKHDADTD